MRKQLKINVTSPPYNELTNTRDNSSNQTAHTALTRIVNGYADPFGRDAQSIVISNFSKSSVPLEKRKDGEFSLTMSPDSTAEEQNKNIFKKSL